MATADASSKPVYALSSLGQTYVLVDPTASTAWRVCLNAAIGSFAVIFAVFLVVTLRANATRTGFSWLRSHQRTRLVVLACVSLATSSVHHIDNFARVPLYFLPAWIYDGAIVTLDIGLMGWMAPASALTAGVAGLLALESGEGAAYGPAGATSQHELVLFVGVLIYCAVMLAGLMHYTVERPWNFTAVANVSILAEAGAAALLLGYALHLFRKRSAAAASAEHAYRRVVNTEPTAANLTPAELAAAHLRAADLLARPVEMVTTGDGARRRGSK
jgi:hypothetical protein